MKMGVNRKNPYCYEGESCAQIYFDAYNIGQKTGHRNDGRLSNGILLEVKTTHDKEDINNIWGGEYYSHLKHNEDFILLQQSAELDSYRHLSGIQKAEGYYINYNIWKQNFYQEPINYFYELKEEWCVKTNKWYDLKHIYDKEWKECQKKMKQWNTEYVKICLKKDHHATQFRLQCLIQKSFLNQFEKLNQINEKNLNMYIGKKIASIDFIPQI
jgi:hypothetical protein